MARRCPSCLLPYGDDEDFCPVDGRRLLADGPRTHLAALSHPGLVRKYNQDAAAVVATPRGAVLVVCDGVSASPRSDQAARLAAASVAESLVGYARQALDEGDHEAAMRDAIQSAHRQLCGSPPDEGPPPSTLPPGTTLVAALIHGDALVLGWVGDSRAYWVSPARSEQLTRDHSWINEIVETGAMDLEEAYRSPNAHAITRCLGPLEGAEEAQPDTHRLALARGGALVLCSDGLWNYTPTPESLAAVVGQAIADDDADAAAHALVDYALAGGGLDNVTVAVHLIPPR